MASSTLSAPSALLREKTERLRSFAENDPHAFLGIHDQRHQQRVVRLWRPGAETLNLRVRGELVEAAKVHSDGLFEHRMSSLCSYGDYQVIHADGSLDYDPYAFVPSVSEMDLHLFAEGKHYELYRMLGAHPCTHQGVAGTRFAVWAPSARSVSLAADFNHWDTRVNPMRNMGHSGVWELFVPGLDEGQNYKFAIHTATGETILKADPYAFQAELRPKTASVVARFDDFGWEDEAWVKRRERNKGQPQPMNIYELHLGSWKQKDGQFLNYREIARELVSYCEEMGFTHVELLPIAEHPLDESWGYQVTGFFSATSRYGSLRDFQAFVNTLHTHGIGVIMDWVPAHFPTDDFALARFDGTALYEHADPREGYHPHWNTYIFNYGRNEVANFLIANALFWLREMHIDGLRVDAVASMLYRDYGREHGEWIPNRHGGRENLEAIEFLKHLNCVTHQRHPGTLVIAEESTAFPAITRPVHYGGLGFDLKWNMGWMNDTLRYFERDPIHRKYHHNDLTFGLLYAFSENFALVLSHDEVVHGKRSLLSKMPGDMWQQFANLRLLYSYLCCQPGKNLLFMGGEIAQWVEWNCKKELEWFLLDYQTHKGIQNFVKAMNHLVLDRSALWERDFDGSGFEWVDHGDSQNSVISYRRKSASGELLCVHNFTPSTHQDYLLPLKGLTGVEQVLNSDDSQFGGSGMWSGKPQITPEGLRLSLAPLATMIYAIDFHD